MPTKREVISSEAQSKLLELYNYDTDSEKQAILDHEMNHDLLNFYNDMQIVQNKDSSRNEVEEDISD